MHRNNHSRCHSSSFADSFVTDKPRRAASSASITDPCDGLARSKRLNDDIDFRGRLFFHHSRRQEACCQFHSLGNRMERSLREDRIDVWRANQKMSWDHVAGRHLNKRISEVDPISKTTPTGFLVGFSAAPVSSLTTSGSA